MMMVAIIKMGGRREQEGSSMRAIHLTAFGDPARSLEYVQIEDPRRLVLARC
jgi:hypothetical protein